MGGDVVVSNRNGGLNGGNHLADISHIRRTKTGSFLRLNFFSSNAALVDGDNALDPSSVLVAADRAADCVPAHLKGAKKERIVEGAVRKPLRFDPLDKVLVMFGDSNLRQIKC